MNIIGILVVTISINTFGMGYFGLTEFPAWAGTGSTNGKCGGGGGALTTIAATNATFLANATTTVVSVGTTLATTLSTSLAQNLTTLASNVTT